MNKVQAVISGLPLVACLNDYRLQTSDYNNHKETL